jgi:hippurate hydrolase
MPHQSVDPVLASAAIIQSLQSIVARQTNPVDSAVVSITMVNGGSAFNVIPDSVELGGTARAILPETRERTEENIRKIVNALATAHGCEAEIDWRAGYPPTINHNPEANRAAAIASDIVGAEKVHMDMPPSMAAEDFAFMLEARKGAYIWLGAGPAQEGRMLHNTGYDFNDSILPVGTSYWVKLVESELAS